jgi:hypothetical protein
VALAFGVTVRLLELLPGVTEANVKRIRPGMTAAEVEALLGGPPVEVGIQWPDLGRKLAEWPGRGGWIWKGATGTVWVTMDRTIRVESARWERYEATSIPRLRDILGI